MLPVTVTSSSNEVDEWVSAHVHSAKAPFLGFDIEWKPTFRSGERQPKAATVQLATTSAALIVQMAHLDKPSAGLIEVLGNNQVTKVGVEVKADLHRLKKDYDISSAGFADIVRIM